MSSSRFTESKVGDTLILVTGNRFHGDEPVTVSRVGSKYIYVRTLDENERREKFDRTTGVEVDQRGIRARLLTQEQYEERAQRSSLFARLTSAGIDVRDDRRAAMPTATLRAILDAVEGNAASESARQ
ncbi:beta barrel domain-containing protein [Streptomyces rubiginosohelvolus]